MTAFEPLIPPTLENTQMSTAMPTRELSKSKLAMYLRTKCDRELYLSLFKNQPKELSAAGLPVPIKSRPGVQLITQSGREFEFEQYDRLISSIPSHVIHYNHGHENVDLPTELTQLGNTPVLILQPQIEPEQFRRQTFNQLGISAQSQALIPPLTGLRPDILLIEEAGAAEYEILPSSDRRRIDPADKRLPISVIDLKNITEANASYSAEVCLYAFFLASWLHALHPALAKRYFVSDKVYLWRHVDMPRFRKSLSTTKGGTELKRLNALREDLADGLVNYLVYMPSVRKFFAEDVPRVIRQGDTDGWDSVPYHVNPKCSSCDWLGNVSWLSEKDKVVFDAHPEHYCFHNAEITDHLSKLPILSRGAAKALKTSGRSTVTDLADISPNEAALREHTILKRDRKQIGARARALVDDATSIDHSAKVPGLAGTWSAEYHVIVNFDAGSGFLTGVAIRGVLSAPFGQKFDADADPLTGFKFLGEKDFVVPKDNLKAEWAALLGFIDQFGTWLEHADKIFAENGWGDVRTQICFWEIRQYQELCNAFGRHLLEVLSLAKKAQRALAWIFPSERLMERESEICPNIVLIRDIVISSVHLPQRFATTVLGTVEHYHYPKLPPRTVDNYYREPLGDAIPRERIFEIWKSPTATVRLFGRTVSIADAIHRYGAVLRAHAWALGSITARLRMDLRPALGGKAQVLNTSMLRGMPSVAHDSKLWNQWHQVSSATDRTEARLAFLTRPEWLEAAYKAIILDELETDHGDYVYTFRVSEDSTEAKIEEGAAFCTIGIVNEPGFPLQKSAAFRLAVDPSTYGYFSPMYSIIAVEVVEFDRANRRARVAFRARVKAFSDIFKAIMDEGVIPIGKERIYILEALPYDDTDSTRDILKAIGNPKCAKPAKEALEALGQAAKKKHKGGKDPDTPIARVLWAADQLAAAEARSSKEAQALADFARTANQQPLNDSQYAAVRACAAVQLSIVWGPPGTGKTDTLVAFLHATVHEGKRRKLLISGPNYRTVEELARRLAHNLGQDAVAAGDFFWVYSQYRDPASPPSAGSHLNLRAIKLKDDSEDMAELVNSARSPDRVTIVATTAHIVDRIVKQFGGGDESVLAEVFDLVVLDESSQLPVTMALRPLSGLRADGQLVVAGDHLQMPPIQALDPPLDAEYLVSSIQTYLIQRFGVPRQELLINYRSNQDLVDYAKTLGYPAKLQAHAPKKDLLLLRPLKEVIATLPASLPQTDAYEYMLDPTRRVVTLIHDDLVSSQANELEAGLVAGLVVCIRRSMASELDLGSGGSGGTEFDDDAFFERGVGVVTPHKAQKALIVRALLDAFPDADRAKVYDAVDTVERFQGGQRQTIIVSFGVGDTDVIEGEEAFLLQMERTNVAVSRAMAKCIVLMPESLAYHLPRDQKAAETSVAIKSYVEEFCTHRQKTTIHFKGEQRGAEVRWH